MAERIGEAQQLADLGYSNKAIDLYQNKINVGVIDNADTDAVILGPNGDLIRLYMKISNTLISDAKFLCYGCPGSMSAMSALTLLLRGKTLNQAKKLTENDILEALGGLPESKQDCADLPIRTLEKAIANYEKMKNDDA